MQPGGSGKPRPFLKWAGGKRQLLPTLRAHLPASFRIYFEPFVGSGALLFDVCPRRAVINDRNAELINCYQVIRDHVDELIACLRKHRNEREYYFAIRDLDRDPARYRSLSPVDRAARFIYLNRTCFNGLYRVNRRGEFNVPFGNYRRPAIVDAPNLRRVSQYLRENDVVVQCGDYEDALALAGRGDFVYLDPPYDPLSETSRFTQYTRDGFAREEQVRLKMMVDTLTERGCFVMLSNSATPFIRQLYRTYRIVIVQARRSINATGAKRGAIAEVIVLNY